MKTQPDVLIGDGAAGAVERVLASRTFARAGRSASILRYISAKFGEGKASEIKEYSIAVDVFGRTDYDSRTDSRVRTEVKKLRDLLEQYYASDGASESLRIEIPIGSYVPVFKEYPEFQQSSEPVRPSSQSRQWRWEWVAAALVAIAAITAAARWVSRETGGQGSIPSIAVLPIRDLSSDHSLQAFCEGLTEELTNGLTNVGGLRVASHSSVARYRNQDRHVRKVGADLNVHAVIDGSVRIEGQLLRISLQLLNVKDGFQLWTRDFEWEDAQRLTVQKKVAGEVEDRFRFYLSGTTRGLARPGTRNADAWHYYLRAAQATTSADPAAAVPLYRAALQQDPNYARAMAGLAISLITLADWLEAKPEEVLEEAWRVAEQAEKIDPDLADVQHALGLVRTFHSRDWVAAESAFRRAIQIDPTDQDHRIQFTRLVLGPTGRWEEEERQIRQAMTLRPGWNALTNRLGNLHMRRGEFEQAVTLFEQSLRQNARAPAAYVHLGEIAMLRGDHAEAMRRFDEARARQRSQWTIGHRAVGMALTGNRAEAERILGTLWSQYEIACIYNALGETDKAFSALESAVARREVQMICVATEPRLRSLRADARFGELLGKLGLPRPR